MLIEDKDGRSSFFITNFCYTFSNADEIENLDICSKNFSLRSIEEQEPLANVRLNAMIMQFFCKFGSSRHQK